MVDDYIEWYNAKRPCWSLGYMTPNDFYDAFMAGEVERRDTFAGRVIDPTPKFVREKLARAEADAESNAIGTSELLCFDAGVYVPLKKTAPVSTNAMRIPALVSTIATGKMEKVSTKLD